MQWSQEKIQETLENAIQKATEDSEFRENLKQNTKEVLEELSGLEIPSTLRLKVVDLNESDIIIPLPKTDTNELSESDELSDADLEQVSGGRDPSPGFQYIPWEKRALYLD